MADSYTGEIRIFAGQIPPDNWVLCDGRTLALNDYQELFSLIGTTFGGNGVSNFAVPNLSGRVAVGDGNGTGLTPRTVGQAGGSDTVTLTEAQMPAHTHTFNASSTPGTTPTAGNNYLATVDSPYHMYLDTTQSTATYGAFSTTAIGGAGASGPHLNSQPSLVLNYMICLRGLYPPIN